MTDSEQFLNILQGSLEHDTFVKLTLGKYRGQEDELKRIMIRKVTVKNRLCLSFIYRYKTKDVTKNVSVDAGVESIGRLLGVGFKSANLFLTTEDIQINFSRKGGCSLSRSGASTGAVRSEGHNREKKRYIDVSRPFLVALGITNERHDVLPSMSRKWKQINKFLEVFHRAFTSSQLSNADDIKVVDFGSGKGYLTFAIHDYLRDTLGVESDVTGIELRDSLVDLCNEAAGKLKIESLRFRQGDVSDHAPDSVDVMIALHACDIATDLAIHMGIRAGAEIIMCAPCCHKQIRAQIKIPLAFQPILQFGVHLGQEAEMITDGLRALLLELHGYSTQIFEFVSLEHTSKNKMLLAVKHTQNIDQDEIRAKIKKIKDFYAIKDQYLETLLEKNVPSYGPDDALKSDVIR